MATVKVYNQTGKETGTLELNPAVFEVAVNPAVVQQVVVGLRANARENIAHTKDRSDVRGGGRKPWRQKGTGRARHGSRRSPIWRAGGITFGPRAERNFLVKINKKVRQKAMKMSLSNKVTNDTLKVIDAFSFEQPKTKSFQSLLEGLKLRSKDMKRQPSVLFVMDTGDDMPALSARNIDRLDIVHVDSLNVLDLIAHKFIVASQSTVQKIEKKFS